MTHTSTEQPEALRLAEVLDALDVGSFKNSLLGKAAAELRRLHARVQELEASQAQRVPLSAEEIWGIERNSYVASRQPEYTTDCFGEDKTVWHETSSFSFPLFARNIEAAHGITQEKQQ